MTMTSAEKPRPFVSGPMMGIASVAMPELEGMANDSTK